MADDQNPTTPEIQLVLQAIAALGERLDRLEQKVDERLPDTRPLWEGLNARVDQLEGRIDRVNDGVGEANAQLVLVNARLEQMAERLVRIEVRGERLDTAIGDVSRVVLSHGSMVARALDDVHALGERVDRLEDERRP